MATQIAQGQVVQARRATPERWAKALQRSLALGLEVFTVADTGERMVTSASQLDTLHRSDGDSCTCKAGLAGDPVCCHRAAVRFVQGRLSVATDCLWCAGSGRQEDARNQRFVTCPDCGGSGQRIDKRLAGRPGVVVTNTVAA